MNSVIFNSKNIAPSKIVCVGRNYAEHIKELGNETPESIVIFCKPNSAISDNLRFISDETRFEGELSFIVFGGEMVGVGFGFDLTKAETQNYLKSKGLPWERAKSFDGAAVFSHFVPLDEEFEGLRFELFMDGVLAQHAGYELMIHKPLDILSEVKSFMSLQDGDIIMSGTPKGVASYKRGDSFKAMVYNGDKLLLEFETTAL